MRSSFDVAELRGSLEDVLGKVVDGVQRSHLASLNHALSEDWDDELHEELAHVELVNSL